jgi:hypothetical protein
MQSMVLVPSLGIRTKVTLAVINVRRFDALLSVFKILGNCNFYV